MSQNNQGQGPSNAARGYAQNPQDFRRFSEGGRPELASIQEGAQAAYGDDVYMIPFNLGNFAPTDPARNVAQQVQQDAAFEWIETTMFGDLHGSTPPWPDSTLVPITIQITDSGAGRALFLAPLPINAMAGSGRQPMILPVSKVFVPLSTITVTAQTFDGTNTWDNVWLVMIGRRVFEYGSQRVLPWNQDGPPVSY